MSESHPSTQQVSPRGRARKLTREEIADAALELIDREGFEALTMRRLARELEVGAMTLYGYFRDKDELLDCALDRAARRFSFVKGEGPWRPRLRELIHTMMQALTEHPGAVEVRVRRPILNPGALRAGEAGIAILREAGFDTAEAAAGWRLLFTFTFGYAAFSAAEPSAEQQAEWRRQLAALPVESYPVLSGEPASVVPWMAGRQPFEHGLELILDGLEARLGERRP